MPAGSQEDAFSVGAGSVATGDASDGEREPWVTGEGLEWLRVGVAPAGGAADAGDPDDMIELMLSETDTMTLLHIAGQRVMADTAAATATIESVDRYESLQAAVARADGYTSSSAQTIAGPSWTRTATVAVQATPPATRTVGLQATNWDIAAVMSKSEAGQDTAGDDSARDPAAAKAVMQDQVLDVLTAARTAPGFLVDVDGAVVIGPADVSTAAGEVRGKRSARSKAAALSVSIADTRGQTLAGGPSAAAGAAATTDGAGSLAPGSVALEGSMDPSMPSISGRSSAFDTYSDAGNSRLDDSQSVVTDGGGGGGGAGGDGEAGADVTAALIAREAEAVLASPSLLQSLRITERAIQQNQHHMAHRLYRARPGAEAMQGIFLGLGDSAQGKEADEDHVPGLGHGSQGSASPRGDDSEAGSVSSDSEAPLH